MTQPPTTPTDWWRTAVVYQVYIRSFSDHDGDGLGDVRGIHDRLDHLAALGVDALWINPWYPSPQADAGYDVADYRDIEPSYGTLEHAEQLIAAAHERGLKVILDIVPNHTSSEHRWFRAALAGDREARSRYLFRPGRGAEGELPPNDWISVFGGPAWTRVTEPDGSPGEWYLHLFTPQQPDLDWSQPAVREEFEDVLRFWFDRDVDGFRIDVAHALTKEPGLPDAGPELVGEPLAPHPAWDQDDVHEIYRAWRRVADDYDPPRVFVAEAWVTSSDRLARYVRSDELHSAFQFDFLLAPFDAATIQKVVTDALAASHDVGAPSTWVLSNHDVPRHVTRYARTQHSGTTDPSLLSQTWSHEPPDIELGRRRARAAVLLTLALPGSAYLYQGEELGLAEVEDIPDDRRQDPLFEQSGRERVGRDGCRVPLPWSGDRPPYGFSPEGARGEPWLPQPDDWAGLTADAQEGQAGSTLELYRTALGLRRRHWTGAGDLTWLEGPEGTVGFRRGDLECWLNTGADPVALPVAEDARVLLRSTGDDSGTAGQLPGDAAVWLHRG